MTDQAETLDRDTVLLWLKTDIQQLRKWATQAHTIKNGVRVQCLRASIYGCSVILQALKDVEIDELQKDLDLIKEKLEMQT